MTGLPKVKKVYKRHCNYHPKRTEGLRYVYNGIPDNRSGELLCKECYDEFIRVDPDTGKMSDVRKANDEGEPSPTVHTGDIPTED